MESFAPSMGDLAWNEVQNIKRENKDLRERVGKLETIVIALATRLVALEEDFDDSIESLDFRR